MKPVGKLDGARWRIVWFRAGDRLAHRVDVLEQGEFHEVLTSIEGTSDESWPTSPPLQEMHFEPRPGGSQVALLVGMAGKSHWSASVEMDAGGQRATFELACRAKTAPERLGSIYAISVGHEFDTATSEWVVGPLRLTLATGSGAAGEMPAHASLLEDTLAGKPPVARSLVVVTPESYLPDWPQTVRWAYSIERIAAGR